MLMQVGVGVAATILVTWDYAADLTLSDLTWVALVIAVAIVGAVTLSDTQVRRSMRALVGTIE